MVVFIDLAIKYCIYFLFDYVTIQRRHVQCSKNEISSAEQSAVARAQRRARVVCAAARARLFAAQTISLNVSIWNIYLTASAGRTIIARVRALRPRFRASSVPALN